MPISQTFWQEWVAPLPKPGGLETFLGRQWMLAMMIAKVSASGTISQSSELKPDMSTRHILPSKHWIGVLTVLIFDPFFVHFCRHRPSKMWKMNWKMRTVNLPPLKFWKMRSKMSKKWNSTFLAPWQPWTPHLMAGPALSYHFPNALCQPQIFLSLYWLVFSPLKVFLS